MTSSTLVAGIDVSKYTQSDTVVAALQRQYGTMQVGALQIQRKQFWSYVTYPLAGATQLNFFGQAVGNNGSTLEDTNLPVQGSFGTSSFILKQISHSFKIPNINVVAYNGLDATTLTSEMLGGLYQAGVGELTINAKTYLQLTNPFLQAPPADGRTHTFKQGQVSVDTAVEPAVDLLSRCENKYILDPELFIASQQNFAYSLSYPSGIVPVRASSIITNNNPLRVGVIFDGFEIRPVQ